MARNPEEVRQLHPIEVQNVLAHLRPKAAGDTWARCDLIIFRLSCCCGLRVKEIVGLDMYDLRLDAIRPNIIVRGEVSKKVRAKRGGQRVTVNPAARSVPLHESPETLADLRRWKEYRAEIGAGLRDPFVCCLSRPRRGQRLSRDGAKRRWENAVKCLGPERARELSVHTGRRTYGSILQAAGRTLVEIRDAMGHTNVATTDQYLHSIAQTGRPDPFGKEVARRFV